MSETPIKLDDKKAPGLSLKTQPYTKIKVSCNNPAFSFYSKYLSVVAISDGSNPYFPGKTGDFVTIGVVTSKHSELPHSRTLNGNTILAMSSVEVVKEFKLSERRVPSDANKIYDETEICLDVLYENTKTKVWEVITLSLFKYSAESVEIDAAILH